MSQYDNTNRGAIWKNDRKDSDRHPDFKGSLNVDGIEYWVSAWRRKEGASPQSPALSFRVERKDAPAPAPAPARGATGFEDMPDSDVDGDSIPF